MLFIKETPVETIIPMAQAIEAVEESLAETSRGNAVVLPRRRIHHANRMLFGVLPGLVQRRHGRLPPDGSGPGHPPRDRRALQRRDRRAR